MNDVERRLAILTAHRIVTSIAFSDIRDYLCFERDGNWRPKTLAEVNPDKMFALKTFRTDKKGRLMHIELQDKNKALGLLLKLHGIRGDQRSHGP